MSVVVTEELPVGTAYPIGRAHLPAGQGGTFVGLRYQRRITIGVEHFDDAINRRSSNDGIAIEA